jgi:hypothetical protein
MAGVPAAIKRLICLVRAEPMDAFSFVLCIDGLAMSDVRRQLSAIRAKAGSGAATAVAIGIPIAGIAATVRTPTLAMLEPAATVRKCRRAWSTGGIGLEYVMVVARGLTAF